MYEENDQLEDVEVNSLLEIFEEYTLPEYIRAVLSGIKTPKTTGTYKWAKLQITRLWSPVLAIIIPLFLLSLLCLFHTTRKPDPTFKVVVYEDKPEEKLEKIEPPVPIVTDIVPDITVTEIGNIDNPDMITDVTIEDYSEQPAVENSVALIKSPVIMKNIIGSNTPGSRGKKLLRFGAPAGTEDAVFRALRWLKKEQNYDGSWEKTKPAMTGLALLTFLAHGELPDSPEFGMTVQKAMEWLVENQEESGLFKGRDNHNYSHPIAAYALCEAYTMTKVPMVKVAAEKAIDIIIKGQNASGGWDYNCKPTGRDDTSYMGWCAQALKAAKLAKLYNEGLEEALIKARDGFKKNYKGGDYEGTFGYTSPGNTGLTGIGTLCLQLLGDGNSREALGGMKALEAATFNWDGGGVYNKNYYWYYITQAKFQFGGVAWTEWNNIFSPTLMAKQTIIKNGIEDSTGKLVDIGYWDMPQEITGHTDGVVMDTCLCTLQLEVYYRYLPSFDKAQEVIVEEVKEDPVEEIIINFQ